MKRILLLIFVFACDLSANKAFSQASHVVISEVYGGGGNTGAQFKNDFIELYNPTTSDIVMTNWSVQYTSAAGNSWSSNLMTFSGTIKAKSFFLIKLAAGSLTTMADLPAQDASGSINMSATTGKVAVCNSVTPLTGTDPMTVIPFPSNLVDFVGYGTANGFEGAVATAPSNSTSLERKVSSTSTATSMAIAGADEFAGNGFDGDNNLTDFVVRTSPQPQNTLSAAEGVVLVPPTFTSGFPKLQTVTTTGFDLWTSLNKPGKTYYVILPDAAAAPSSADVKNGHDQSGTPVNSGFAGTINVIAASTPYKGTVSSINSNTDYDVYVVSEDLVSTIQAAPIKLDVTTLDPSDATPPNFYAFYPDVTTVISSSFTLRTGLNEPGKSYFVVLPDNAAVPTSQQVKNGTNASDVAVTLKGTVNVIAINTEYTASVTGLTESTSYDVYVVGEDNIPNLQASPVKIDVTTQITPYIENFNTCIGDVSSFSQVSVSGVHFWDCTSFGNNTTNGVQINGGTGTGSTTNEDWLISPQLTLGGNASVSFDNKKEFNGPDITLKISVTYDGTDPTAASWNDLPFNKSAGAFVSSGTVDLSAYVGLKAYIAIIYTSGNTINTGARWTIDNFVANDAVPSYLITSVNKVKDFGYIAFPNASAAKTFTILGQGITTDLTATAPANFELSKDGSSFSGSIVFTPAEIVNTQTVYVRFRPTAAGIGFLNSIIEFSSGSFLKGVRVSGVEGIDARLSTFDVTAYNLEFFGTDVKDGGNTGTEFGPLNDPLQIANVTTVLETLGSDIYGVEEVSDDAAFAQLVSNLPGYAGILSDRWSHFDEVPAVPPVFPPQKVGFIYNTSVVNVVSARPMFKALYDAVLNNAATIPGIPGGDSKSFWSSGRLPFMIKADVTINGITQRIILIDIHAKSSGTQDDFLRRKFDVQVLHDSLIANYPNDKIILLGDYNDYLQGSIYTGSTDSPYKSFVDDANFNPLTYTLSQSGAATYLPSGGSFIDHILVSNELTSSYVASSVFVEDTSPYIISYVTTTSDHLPVTARFTLTKDNQTITFDPLTDKAAGDPPIVLTASSSSGLPISYISSNTFVATVTGNLLTIVGAGSTIITASQAGNASFNPAADMPQSLLVNKGAQTITFNALPGKAYGDAPFALTGVSSSGLALTYESSDVTVATISGSTVTILKAGNTTITASQAGNANFNGATSVDQPLAVSFGSQTITFSSLPAKVYGDAPFTLTATASSGLPVSYISSNTAVATISGSTLTIVGAGNTTITASQSGSGIGWNSSPDVPQPLVVSFASQTITFNPLAPKIINDAPFTLTATASSGLPVSYTSSNTAVATISGSTVTIVGVGNTTITASQGGDSNFTSAPPVDQPLTVSLLTSQTITFNSLPAKLINDAPFTLTATASSGLPVSYTSSNTAVATISGSTVTIVGVGNTTITASQAGNSTYNVATPVDQPLTVSLVSQTITFNSLSTKVFGDAPFTLTATATSGLPVSYISSNTAVATISGSTVTIVAAGSTTITASQSGSSGYSPATDVPRSLVVILQPQTITFAAIADRTLGDPAFVLAATASSGLSVSYATANDKVTLAGSNVTLVKAGRATITASQAGNANISAATAVDRSFCINPVKPIVTSSNLNTETPVLTSNSTSGNQWYKNGILIGGATNATLSVTGPGIYKVQVRADDCLSAFSSDIPIIVTGDLTSTHPLIAYPNPATNYIEVSGIAGEIGSSQVIDVLGKTSQIVLQKNIDVYRGNVEDLSPGIYFLRIQEGASVHQVKFVKK